jgi:C-terminal processing protease CtpA/Prc
VLGDFLGQTQNAFYFYHQDNFTPYPALSNALPQISRFKKTVILTDDGVQSSTEVMVASLKRLKFGLVVGSKTKGWGSVERVFNLQNQIDDNQIYSVFLVHTLTLADDNQPIEGRGVLPDVDVTDKDWQNKLAASLNSPALTAAVKNIFSQ